MLGGLVLLPMVHFYFQLAIADVEMVLTAVVPTDATQLLQQLLRFVISAEKLPVPRQLEARHSLEGGGWG